MDSRPVPVEHLTAGQEYMDALVALGLIPAFLGWAWDPLEKQWLLVLVTSIVDAGGPLALNKLLFRAYNAKATPKQISPFIVRIFSPELIGEKSSFWNLLDAKGWSITSNEQPAMSADGRPLEVTNVIDVYMGLVFESINCYKTLPGAVKKAFAGYHARHHEWQLFRRRVEALAA